jgi:hypothetical protein
MMLNLTALCTATVWQSHAHATAIKADPLYSTFIQDRDALVTAPVYEVHVRFSGNPQRTLEAPVVEVVYYKSDDREANPDARPAAETQEMVRRVTCREESLQVQGFVAISWGVAIEDGTRGVNLGGWRSVEVSSFGRALSHLSSFRPVRCKRLNTFHFLLTGPHAFGHVR